MTDNSSHWHLSKSVNIGQIISILLLVGALVQMWNTTQEGIRINSSEIAHIKKLQEIQSQRSGETNREIKRQLDSLNAKVDKVVEKLFERTSSPISNLRRD